MVTSLGYLNFYAEVRAVNYTLLPAQRIHVWLGDPPVDWARVKTEADLPTISRNQTPADIIESQILSEGKMGLVIYGIQHFFGHASITELVAQHSPGAFFIVTPYSGFYEKDCSESLERTIVKWPLPALITHLRDTTLQSKLRVSGCHYLSLKTSAAFRPYGYTEAQKVHLLAEMEDRASGLAGDAILYLGSAATLTKSPDLYLDGAFRKKIVRRVGIMVDGQELTGSDVVTILCRQSIFDRTEGGTRASRMGSTNRTCGAAEQDVGQGEHAQFPRSPLFAKFGLLGGLGPANFPRTPF